MAVNDISKKKSNTQPKQLRRSGFDYTMLFTVIVLVGLGVVMVYSATYYRALVNTTSANGMLFVNKQLQGAIIGLVIMIALSFFDYHYLRPMINVAVVGCIALLIMIRIPGLGVEEYGSWRWVKFGPLQFQPSEVAKYVLAIYLADRLATYRDQIWKQWRLLLRFAAVPLVFSVLVMIQPNMSMMVCYVLLTGVMLFVAGLPLGWLALMGSGAAGLGYILINMEEYRKKRLMIFTKYETDPQNDGYQLLQSIYAITAGGFFGVGIGQSRQKYLYLPMIESDFIFCIIVEELGLVGAFAVLALFGLLLIRCVRVGSRCEDRFGSLTALAVGVAIAIQTILNVAVVTASMPPTGLPLPFISAGNTNLIITMAAMGVVLNITRQVRGGNPRRKETTP